MVAALIQRMSHICASSFSLFFFAVCVCGRSELYGFTPLGSTVAFCGLYVFISLTVAASPEEAAGTSPLLPSVLTYLHDRLTQYRIPAFNAHPIWQNV